MLDISIKIFPSFGICSMSSIYLTSTNNRQIVHDREVLRNNALWENLQAMQWYITHAIAYYYLLLLSMVDPRYVVLGRKYFIKTAVPQIYSECRQAVKKELSTISFVSTTANSCTCDPYISLSVHFIDGDWNLKSKCLETEETYFPQDHTGEFIAQNLTDVLFSWDLNESIASHWQWAEYSESHFT